MKFSIIILSLIICISVVSSNKLTRAESLSDSNPNRLKRKGLITLHGKTEAESYFYMSNSSGSKYSSSWTQVKFDFTNKQGLINDTKVDSLISCDTRRKVFMDETRDDLDGGSTTGRSIIPWRKISKCKTNTIYEDYMTLTIVDDGNKVNNPNNSNVFVVEQYFDTDVSSDDVFENKTEDRVTYCNKMIEKANSQQKKIKTIKQKVTDATLNFIANCNNQINAKINKDDLKKQEENIEDQINATETELEEAEKEKKDKETTLTNKKQEATALEAAAAEIEAQVNDIKEKLNEATIAANDAEVEVQKAKQSVKDEQAKIDEIKNIITEQNEYLETLNTDKIPDYSDKIKLNKESYKNGLTELKGFRGVKKNADASEEQWNKIKNTNCLDSQTTPINKDVSKQINEQIGFISTGNI